LEMAIPANRKLWEIGVPLNSAWLEFADADDKRRYSGWPISAKLKEQRAASGVPSISEFFGLLSSELSDWKSREEFKGELRESLLESLFSGDLWAFGYRVAPSVGRSPVRIDADSFENDDPDWKHESLIVRGFEYTQIRIVDPAHVENGSSRRKGRIGSNDAIRGAISSLQKRGVNLCAIPRKVACNEIRSELGNPETAGSGLSDQNLAKYILEICPKRAIGK
jgi:hypothetical protein